MNNKIRNGSFHGNEFRIPCDINDVQELRAATGGTHSWNETVGDYIRVTRESPAWDLILQMKS